MMGGCWSGCLSYGSCKWWVGNFGIYLIELLIIIICFCPTFESFLHASRCILRWWSVRCVVVIYDMI
jgi:hypothetical protein